MASSSSSSSKQPCATCGHKGVGIFKCEGCTQVFCRKHVNEHRDALSHQLDEIVSEYDSLQQTIAESKNQDNSFCDNPLIQQIDKWESDAVEKIKKAADEARQQVKELSASPDRSISKDLHTLAGQLRKAREDDDYVETDLKSWMTTIEKLKCDMNTVSPLVNVYEDSTTILIGKIHVSIPTPKAIEEEKFGEFYGNLRIEDNGRVALHTGTSQSNGHVRGIKEYTTGKHKIRFLINKRNAIFNMSFNIISKSSTSNLYGWYTDDDINNPDYSCTISKDFKDFQGENKFELELTIDCDQQKISYFNERTKNKHEMKVNIQICPFPWQLQFELFDSGDRVQLISSHLLSA